MKKTVLLFICVLVWGCSSSSLTKLPNGQDGFYIKCPRSIKNCYDEANESCPNGYNVIDKTDNSGITTINNNVISVRKFEMMIQCR